MKQKAVVVFQIPQRKFSVDLEIPLDITAKELVAALNAACCAATVFWRNSDCAAAA